MPTWKGRKSFALPEFDPFWERVQELDLVVGMHSGDPGYPSATSTSGRASNRDPLPFKHPGSPAFSR